jgi:formylglycine-generating enzyme required for sulfatase activity
MVYVPSGSLVLGDDLNVDKATKVDVAAFCIDRTEVTVEAYAACVGEKGCSAAATSGFCNGGVAGRETHPINCVTWQQSKTYCETKGKRLPTEEEWEFAARGTDGRLFPWGNTAPSNQLCWDRYGIGKPNATCVAGTYPTGDSPFGVKDLAGNVYEFTSSLMTDQGTERVGRGGAWGSSNPAFVRSALRTGYLETASHGDLGFRCASAPTP